MKRIIALLTFAAVLLLSLPAGALRLSMREGLNPIPLDPIMPVVDTDCDGIIDAYDPEPKNNTFVSTVSHDKVSIGIDADYSYTYKWDYSWFKRDPAVFNAELCRLSSLIAGLGYHRNGFDSPEASDDYYSVSNVLGSNLDLPELMAAHGMRVEEYNLNTYYSDGHVTLVDMGVHTVKLGRKSFDVVLIAFRGTNGTWAEWNSNFEVGHTLDNCEPELMRFKYGVAQDWNDADNHMGFDVTANRVMELLDEFYSQRRLAKRGNVVYWVTGHSRGAAIANLCAAKLIDAGKTTFAYTFACPNNTVDPNAGAAGYNTIFNVVNEGDLVPYLPFTEWGFTRYGVSANLEMTEERRSEWKSMMGETYDFADTTLDNALDKLKAIMDCRNDAYSYTCSCHGDGTDDSIKTSNWYFTSSNRDKAIAKTPACLAGYYKLELEDATFYWTHHCQPPIFFMQMLAAFMCDRMTKLEFADYDIADKYESAKWALATAALMGVGHPHYCESYFILADDVTAADFR